MFTQAGTSIRNSENTGYLKITKNAAVLRFVALHSIAEIYRRFSYAFCVCLLPD
jgi:hypothetical protein